MLNFFQNGLNNRQKREMKELIKEAMDEWTANGAYLTQNEGVKINKIQPINPP